MNKKEVIDVIIIGGGPIGLACGLEAEKKGLNYLIIEKGTLVNSLYNYPLYMTFFSTSNLLEIGGIPFTSISSKPTRPEALEYYRRVAAKVNVKIHLFEKVKEIVSEDGNYKISTDKKEYTTEHVIIATGFYDTPKMLNIPGENLSKVDHYYKDPHFYAMQKVLVVGAKNSAVDAALETCRKGAEVTMVIRGEGIGERVKYWKKPDIENRIKEGSIKAYFNSNIIAIREKEVDIETAEGKITLENDYVLAMTGYRPNYEFLEETGIKLSDEGSKFPEYNPETMETNLKNVFLAGVVCGGMETHKWFIENSRVHAVQIMNKIVAKSRVSELQ